MRKFFVLFSSLLILCFATTVSAASKTGPSIPTSQKINECYQNIWNGVQGHSTKVGVIYLNRALTTFDDDVDYDVLEAVIEGINPQDHIMVDGTACLTELANMGVADLALADRADVIDILKKNQLDYAVLVQVDPFQRKERMAAFRYTLEMTSDIMLRIVDVKENKYLYNTKIVRMAKHGAAVGGVSNKSAVAKLLKDVGDEIYSVVSTRIPKG